MDELEVLKLKYQHMEKRNKRLTIETWENDMVLRSIANKFIKQNSIADEFRIHLYSGENPLLKALEIELNHKWVEMVKKAKEEINNDN